MNMKPLFKDMYTKEQFNEFKDLIAKEDFGKTGEYVYFCRHCNSTWNFEDKTMLEMWKHLHNIGGCGYDMVLYHKTKNSKKYLKRHNNIPKEVHSFVKKRPVNKSTISAYSTLILNEALEFHGLSEPEKIETVETNDTNTTPIMLEEQTS